MPTARKLRGRFTCGCAGSSPCVDATPGCSLAPIVALAAERHVWLLVLFALPAVAVSRGIAIAAGRAHHALHDDLTGRRSPAPAGRRAAGADSAGR
jgi:hypothetical protein